MARRYSIRQEHEAVLKTFSDKQALIAFAMRRAGKNEYEIGLAIGKDGPRVASYFWAYDGLFPPRPLRVPKEWTPEILSALSAGAPSKAKAVVM